MSAVPDTEYNCTALFLKEINWLFMFPNIFSKISIVCTLTQNLQHATNHVIATTPDFANGRIYWTSCTRYKDSGGAIAGMIIVW